MDTPMDIARDEWWQAHLYGCETCKFSKRSKTGKYYCDNRETPAYGLEAEDVYSCGDWDERRKG